MALSGNFVILFFVATLALVHAAQLDLVLAARGLPNMDIFDGAPDPYAIVYYARNGTENFTQVGQTNYVNNNNNPDWGEVFRFNFTGAFSQQRLKLDIYDSDIDADDYIGSVEFRLRDVLDAGYILARDLTPAGNGNIVVSGYFNGSALAGGKVDPRLLHPARVINIPDHFAPGITRSKFM